MDLSNLENNIRFHDWQLFIDSLSEEVLIVDPGNYVILANVAARENFGYQTVEPYRYTFEDFYHGLWNNTSDCPIKAALKNGETITKTYRTGAETSYRITAKPVKYIDNKIEWLACSGKYINSEPSANTEPASFSFTGEWTFELNQKQEITKSNRYMSIFTGIDRSVLAENPLSIIPLLAPEFVHTFTKNIQTVVQGPTESNFRVLFKKVNNSFYGGYVTIHKTIDKNTIQVVVRPFRNAEIGSEKYFEQIRLQNYITIIADQMAQSETFAQGYQHVIESISEVLKVDFCGFIHINEQKKTEIKVAMLNGKLYDSNLNGIIKPDIIENFAMNLEKKGLLKFHDLSEASAPFAPLLTRNNIKSFMAIPLNYRGRLAGAMGLGYTNSENWPEYKTDFANTVGSIVLQSFIQEETRKKLHRANESFRNIFENSSDAVFIVAFNGSILEVNRTAETLCGCTRKELQTKNVSEISKAENLDLAQMPFEMMQSHQMIFGTELLNAKGDAIPIETREKIIRYQNELAILVIARDVRHRRELNKLMVQTIANTEEKERKRIAEGLHDDVGPLLSTIRIYADLLHNTELTPSEIKDYSAKMKEIINQSIATIREISRNLMPGVLNDFGLVEAIKEFCDNLNKTGIIRINFDSDAKHYNLESQIENIIYGVVKELINNTIKHADASEINLTIDKTNNSFIIKYIDNGIGIDIEKHLNSSNTGLGIKNLLSKINAISGKVTNLNNGGFGVEIIIPINEN